MYNESKAMNMTAVGMLQKLKMIQAISSNISNTNTIGYQRQIPESISFGSVLNETAFMKDTSQGQLKKTGNKFDVAIEGNAYFLIETKDGIATSKNGNFHLNEKGLLVDSAGNEIVVIEKSDKPLSFAKNYDIKINQQGEISIGAERYGRLALQIQDNKPVRVHQGFVEGSNVNLIDEMVSLQMTFRAFEASEKALGMEASVDRDLIEKYGRNV